MQTSKLDNLTELQGTAAKYFSFQEQSLAIHQEGRIRTLLWLSMVIATSCMYLIYDIDIELKRYTLFFIGAACAAISIIYCTYLLIRSIQLHRLQPNENLNFENKYILNYLGDDSEVELLATGYDAIDNSQDSLDNQANKIAKVGKQLNIIECVLIFSIVITIFGVLMDLL